MAIPSEVSRARLAAMGIEVWQRRGAGASADAVPEEGSKPAGPRIRLSSGSGDWLLVLEGTVPERYRALVADITAAIGAERCRFGQWAHSEDAGAGPGEWSERGISRVLVFGAPELDDPRVVRAPALEALAASPEERRRLWAGLKHALKA